jgi:peptidoglycan/LPS O-acetylase OafA/YrhL
MKRAAAIGVVALAIGIGAGVYASRSAESTFSIQTGVAVLLGGDLLFCLWLWYRARPGSGDAIFLPVLVLLLIAALVGLLPRLLWPAIEPLRMAGSVASVLLTALAVLISFKRRRRLPQRGRPAGR